MLNFKVPQDSVSLLKQTPHSFTGLWGMEVDRGEQFSIFSKLTRRISFSRGNAGGHKHVSCLANCRCSLSCRFFSLLVFAVPFFFGVLIGFSSSAEQQNQKRSIHGERRGRVRVPAVFRRMRSRRVSSAYNNRESK